METFSCATMQFVEIIAKNTIAVTYKRTCSTWKGQQNMVYKKYAGSIGLFFKNQIENFEWAFFFLISNWE